MIMQFISVFFGALAVWALFYDYIVRSGNTVLLTGEAWFALSPASINLVQAVIERYIWPPLWGQIVLPILKTPFWIVCAATAFIFAAFWMILRRRRDNY